MLRSPDIRYDVASAISQGRRPYQEDAIVTDFPIGADLGFAVLADGMGGHAAGDVASKIVVTEVYSELKLQSGDRAAFSKNLPDILRGAAMAANDCVKGHIESNAETAGMGATLVAPVFLGTNLWWISIGDSPLFLFRDGELSQINEDHSMAPQIDFMIRSGMMDEQIGRNHPDRSCLTSVLGGEQVPRIDCPNEPLALRDGDILLVASDGIQYLAEDVIREILAENTDADSATLAALLLDRLEHEEDPEQDNASFSIIKVRLAKPRKATRQSRGNRSGERFQPEEDLVAVNTPTRHRSGLFARGTAFFRGTTS
jgi:protein phosphatase